MIESRPAVLVLVAMLFALGGCSGATAVAPAAADRQLAHAGGVTRDVRPLGPDAVTITEFNTLPHSPSSSGYYVAVCLAAGPGRNGGLWVAEGGDQDFGGSAVAHLDLSGRLIATYPYYNSAFPSFVDITAGPDGAMWLTDQGDSLIMRVTSKGTITTYAVNRGVGAITAGPDGALWFVAGGTAIARITTSGQITVYTAGIASGTYLYDIAAGPDGALWFTEWNVDRIGRITTGGIVSQFSKGISRRSRPWSIAAGPDGALWFTEINDHRIGRITTSGVVTEYSGISGHEHPGDIAAGPDNALWFTETSHAQIGRISTSGAITEYVQGVKQRSDPDCIVQAADHNMWFTQYNLNLLGRVDV